MSNFLHLMAKKCIKLDICMEIRLRVYYGLHKVGFAYLSHMISFFQFSDKIEPLYDLH